jgi:hypothetical protein
VSDDNFDKPWLIPDEEDNGSTTFHEHEIDAAEYFRDEQEARLQHEKQKQRVEDAARYAVTFPTKAYRGSLAKLAMLLGEDSEVPYEFIYLAALSTFGLIASNKLALSGDGLDTRPNLYVVLLGPTGCKKTTALNMATKFFGPYLNADPKQSLAKPLHYPIAGSGEGLLKLFTSSSTKQVLLSVDELQSMLQKCRVEGSTLGPMLASLFEGDPVGMATKDNQQSITNGLLGLQGAITTESWEGIWTKGTERELGLLNRLFLVSGTPRGKVFSPKPVDPVKYAGLQTEVNHQLNNAGPIGFSADGRAVLEKFYYDLDLQEEESTRLDTLSKKLSLILAASSDKKEIDADVATAAVAMCEYQLKVRRLLAPSQAATLMAATETKIRKFLELHPDKSFYASTIADKTGLKKRVGIGTVQQALLGMEKGSEVSVDHGKTGKGKYGINKLRVESGT